MVLFFCFPVCIENGDTPLTNERSLVKMEVQKEIVERGLPVAVTKTKQLILEAALELFSTRGFDATSTGQIADAVGIRKSSLYNHFRSKEDILDTLIEVLTEEYHSRSLLSVRKDTDRHESFSVDAVIAQVVGHIQFLLHDSHISKVRKLMTTEQFRNPKLARLQTLHAYEYVMGHHISLIRRLVDEGILPDGDAEAMAAQFAFPISAWISLCDRQPEREQEILSLAERHIRQFFKVYTARI